MRINVARLYKNSNDQKAVFNHWITLLAEEYAVDRDDATKWAYHKNCHEFVINYLKSHGWDVESYVTPDIEQRCISYGFVVNDGCEQLMKWRLLASCG